MDIKLELIQHQTLSQKMIQSAEILQMSTPELIDYIKDVSLENPVIDFDENDVPIEKKDILEKKLDHLKTIREQTQTYALEDNQQKDLQDSFVRPCNDLATYILSQLMTDSFSFNERNILEYIVYNLDSKGYLKEDLEEISKRFSVSIEKTTKLLTTLQQLDPAGVCARTLEECLLLQLERIEGATDVARKIIKDYLVELGKNQLPTLAKKLQVSLEDVQVATNQIKMLNPKPGSSFGNYEDSHYIIPEIIVVKINGSYEILLNDHIQPKCTINPYYRQLLTQDSSKEIVDYISSKIKQCEWIQSCISQRNITLNKVAKVIVDWQTSFFEYGAGHLSPLRLIDVANKIGMHESTICRAIKGKFLECSWGVYSINYFFSKGVDCSAGEKISSETVKNLIEELIHTENKKKPYSDRILSEKLSEKGLIVSRRTVAKYRDSLGIKDASGRKAF